MNEDRTAKPSDSRTGIVVDLDNQVVEAVLAPQPVAWFIGRAPEGPVVAAVAWIFAPGVVGAYPAHWQEGARPRQAIGAPPQADRAESSDWRAAVALALERPDAGAAQRHANGLAAGAEKTLCTQTGPRPDAQEAQRSAITRFV